MKAVIDTNVIVSAVFFKGNPQKILEKLSDKKFELICSQKIIEERIDTEYEIFQRLGKETI